MSITIEKNIPAPLRPSRNHLPFDKMEVGDSFLAQPKGSSWAWLFSAIQFAQNKHNIKLTTKAAEGGRRVWRTE